MAKKKTTTKKTAKVVETKSTPAVKKQARLMTAKEAKLVEERIRMRRLGRR